MADALQLKSVSAGYGETHVLEGIDLALAHAESHILLDSIATLPKDIAVLIIEHDMDLVFRFADRITVLVSGAIFAEGTPAEIAANREVRSVYLGSALDA